MRFKNMHSAAPIAVGITKASAAHLRLPVSFFIVIRVVEQGQWKREKLITHRAVTQLQPFSARRPPRAESEE